MLTDVSDRTAHVLWLLRMLIEYGRQLAETVQNRCANTDLTEITCGFGAIDIAMILSRITRGSQLAAALKDPNARASVICLRTAAEIAAQVRRRAVLTRRESGLPIVGVRCTASVTAGPAISIRAVL